MYLTLLCALLHLSSSLCKPREQGRFDVQLNKRASRNKCCRDVGCFSTAYPFTSKARPLSFLPRCPEDLDIKYTVFSRRSLHVGYDIMPGNRVMLQRSDFNASRPTKVIIHGFIEDTNLAQWMHQMKQAFLLRGDFNVILVDWGKGSGLPYTQATANTRAVGAELAHLIEFLQVNGAAPETFHIVGHSLGSHIAGYAGERLQYLGRITALDPADPYFTDTDKIVRLDPSDALFVDVIHTDGDHILSTLSFDGGFGMADAIGHVDFYPNGGEMQPGCDSSIVTSVVVSGIYDGGKKFVACDHLRVYDYFTESINSKCPFTAYPCDSYEDFEKGKCGDCGPTGCGKMGFHADKNVPKQPTKYYLDTGDKFPFCRYHFQMKVSVGNDGRKEYGKIYVVMYGSDDATDELLLTPDDIFIEPGKTYSFSVLWHKDIGSLRTVDLRWRHKVIYTRPGHWSILRTPTVNFRKVTVSAGELAQRSSFCTSVSSVDSKVRETFYPCS